MLFLIVSAFASAARTAFFSLDAPQIRALHESRDGADARILRLLERSEYLLATLLIVSNTANVSVILLTAFAAGALFDFSLAPAAGFLLLVVGLVVVLLLFGEALPRKFARRNALAAARRSVSLVAWMERLCRPLSMLFIHSTAAIGKALIRKKRDLSVDELSKALEMSSSENQEEKEMLAEIIRFYKKTASEIMTPRLDVEDIEVRSTFREVLDFVVESGYSRIPVYAGTEDDIKGILYIKDLLPYIDKPDTFRWQSLIRPAYFVPETKKIDDLLEEFRTNKIHMAIVVDEFGGTSGIVTMEDILEEIVGEISDEYDEEEKQYIRLADGSLIFEAKIALNDFFRVTGADPAEFADLTEEVETLAGLLLEIKGDFPKRREIVEYRRFRFQVLEVDNRRIQKVKYTCLSGTDGEEGGAA